MSKIKDKLYDWKDRLRDRHMLTLVVTLVSIITVLGLYTYKRERTFRQVSENRYNMAFFELVDYVENVSVSLEKALVSSTPQHGVETLTEVWREANLAQAYLAMLPIGSEELTNTSKFLNQVSDYSYSLSRKNIYNESLSQDDLNNLKNLYKYSVELQNTLNQLSSDINDERIKWGELNKKGSTVFATEVSNISKDSFNNIENSFHEYAGLIYDGAFSEHMTSIDKKGLTGEDIDEESAKNIALQFVDNSKIKEVKSNGLSENTDMPCYDFSIIINSNDEEINCDISITKKGGHIVFMNLNRNIGEQTISEENAVEIGKELLNNHGFINMSETYYMVENGIITINYAYTQNTEYGYITVYSDLVKVKLALDNGEILGIETTGYLNSHYERDIDEVKISVEKAKESLNKELELQSERLTIIPTKYSTELLCWEFKAKVEDAEYLIYINANTGKEEDILVLKVMPNGTLTM